MTATPTLSKALLLFEHPANRRPVIRALISNSGCHLDETVVDTRTASQLDAYSLLVFDVHRPTWRLLEVLGVCRNRMPESSFLVIGGATTEDMRAAVLEAGANAYLMEPLDVGELTVRIHVALRRHRIEQPTSFGISLGQSVLDLKAHRIRTSEGPVHLTRTECDILGYLASHLNRTVPADELVEHIWGSDTHKGVHSIRTFIKRLRQKLEPDPANPQFLVTAMRTGYRLQPHPQSNRSQATPTISVLAVTA